MLLRLTACTATDAAPPGEAQDTAAAETDTDTGDSGDTAIPSAPRAAWVWDTDIPGDAPATDELLAFAADHGVTTLMLNCDPVGYGLDGAEARYVAFVEAAHAEGIEVYGVSGYPWFSVPCDAALPGQDTCWPEGWQIYEACAASPAGFDGIMDDTEPASTPDGSWSADYVQRAEWHLEYLRGIRERIGDAPLHHAIPAWYDELEPLELDGESATLDVWIARTVDAMGVMAYRDDADAILELASAELDRGSVWIGVETGPSDEGEEITFAEEGGMALDGALDEIEAEVGGHPNFRGFMVDAYESWRGL